MSATSGISASPDLTTRFAHANGPEDSTRFLKISIANEFLVHDLTIQAVESFEDDLSLLEDVLEADTPAYVLAKTAPLEWMVICYVPDSAKVRDKMLYAATRLSLLKSLGSSAFTQNVFVASTSDLREACASRKRNTAVPGPLSAREQEMLDVRAADSQSTYDGNRTRSNHLGTGVGLPWSQDAEEAVRDLGASDRCSLVLLTVDKSSETLILQSASDAEVRSLASRFPSSEPCYAVFAWPHSHTSPPRREIIFIYSCPSTSPIKYRMVYSSGASSVFSAAKALLSSDVKNTCIASRKIEVSNPLELNEDYLVVELGLKEREVDSSRMVNEAGPFAKPKRPARR